MSNTLSAATAATEHALRLAFARFDAAAAQKSYTSLRKSGTAGQRILAALQFAGQTPKADHAALVKQFNCDIESALQPLAEIEKEAISLLSVAEHIEHGKALPADIDNYLVALAKTLRAAAIAGHVDGRAIASQVQRRVSDASAECKRLNATLIEKSRSAAKVASAKALLNMLSSAGADTVWAKQNLARCQAVHRWKHEATPRRKPVSRGVK